MRLREREKSRDWSKHDRSYPVTSTQRRWSAESYNGKNVASSRKPSSPQHLPHLENRPASVESNYDSDLRRGMQAVVPPVPFGPQYARYIYIYMHFDCLSIFITGLFSGPVNEIIAKMNAEVCSLDGD